MDVESAKTIQDALAQAKTDGDALLASGEAAGLRLVQTASAAFGAALSNGIADALEAGATLIEHANTAIAARLDSLDGYTLELDPPIVIRAVRLTKPKAGA